MTLCCPPRPCPTCDGVSPRLLYRQNFAHLDEGGLLPGYDGIPGQDFFDVYYRELSKYDYNSRQGEEPEWVRDRFRTLADQLEPWLASRQSRILDVGCATGGLLAEFKIRGFKNVLGIEPSPAAARAALDRHGVKVLTGSLPLLAASGETFDLIILTGTLEHVRDLHGLLQLISQLLSAEGQVFLEVPDATAFTSCRNAPYQEFSIEHINFFSHTSLANLLRRFGYAQIWSRKARGELSRDVFEPVIRALFRRDRQGPRLPELDTETEPALRDYIAQSRTVDDRVCEIIDRIVVEDRPILVWGVGTHTLRLLATSRLAEARIRAFIESNARYHGRQLRGVPIIAPAELPSYPEPVLVSSFVYQREIVRQIREGLGCANEVILLYEI